MAWGHLVHDIKPSCTTTDVMRLDEGKKHVASPLKILVLQRIVCKARGLEDRLVGQDGRDPLPNIASSLTLSKR